MDAGRDRRHLFTRAAAGECHAVLRVCHAAYSYGASDSGAARLSDATPEVARLLSDRSFDAGREPPEPVRLFLEEEGTDYYGRERYPVPVERPQPHTAAVPAMAKRRRKPLTPEQLREQPQFKLPITGGKAGVQSPVQADEKQNPEVAPGSKSGAVA
jgi:hypothetical protein